MIASRDGIQTSALNTWLSRRVTLRRETIAFIVILLLAVFTRFYALGERVMSHDESLHTQFSFNLYRDGNFQHTPSMHGPILFHATAFAYFLFGDNDFTGRLYTAVLGVMMVMSPFLFRRWLGRWGAILASFMFLISPLLMYYNRYIRHDTPSILFGILMVYSVLMYLNGPEDQRRRSRWLYLLATAMILNLGSKETAFIYIAILASFLILYWLARLLQYRFTIPGKPVFYILILGILSGGVMALGMYIILDIIPIQVVAGSGVPFANLSSTEQSALFLWTGLAILFVFLFILIPAVWVFRRQLSAMPWREALAIFAIALFTCLALVILEEFSHLNQSAAPVTEDAETVDALSAFRWFPLFIIWGMAILGAGGLVLSFRDNDPRKRKDGVRGGVWGFLDQFPEFDIIVVIVTLILPWITALIPFLMRPVASDYTNIANSLPTVIHNLLLGIPAIDSPQQVGQVYLGAMAWIPLMILSAAIGLAWNWRRWVVVWSIFHVIFALFFTTMFTNIAGLATGMVYSLGYWLEQQGVRRGSQPQYYYLLIIMPFYEFLPVIGSVFAMLAGTAVFWRRRRYAMEIQERQREITHQLAASDASDGDEELAGSDESAIEPGDKLASARLPDEAIEAESKLKWLTEIPFLLLIAWWAVLNLVGYSLAGEKMPWLGTHLTVPLIFLSAWYLDSAVFSKIRLATIREKGWILLLILPLLIISLARVIGSILIGRGPFAGLEKQQLEQTYNWLGILFVAIGCLYVVARASKFTGWSYARQMTILIIFGLLALITFRSAWMASFVNYDSAREYLVYAHAAPAVKTVLSDIEEISRRTTDGLNLKFAYDNEVSWPYSWYFRNFRNAVFVGENPTMQNLSDAVVVVAGAANRSKVEPIVEDRYQTYRFNRMWWPMQDYFNLTADRILNTFDFSPDNHNAALIRGGMFDIWWMRDYAKYGRAVNKDFSEVNWPVSDEMFVYVRNDVASQIWSYGLGAGSAITADSQSDVGSCVVNWVDQQAIAVFNDAEFPLQRPLGIEVGLDGRVYVADEALNQVLVFDRNGNFMNSLDSPGLGFARPNGVAVDEDGNIFVADTWNYRIQVLSQSGDPIAVWGQPGEYGFEAQTEPNDGFWGPRDVAVDESGRVYVADTGNKRIRVYAYADGQQTYLYDIGSGGSAPGQLDEPSSVIVSSDGKVFVADTWNRRISVFTHEGEPINNFRVRGWYNDLGNRPYLALDEVRNQLYITDPEAGRVLVYNPEEGVCLGSFGQLGTEPLADGEFARAGGIAVDDEGFVYVTDSSAGRALKFAPFEPPASESNGVSDEIQSDIEVDPQSSEEGDQAQGEAAG